MDTVLLLCLCDSIVTTAVTAAIPVVQLTQEAETNCKDVLIVGIICTAIVLVAAIVTYGFWYWKDAEKEAVKQEQKEKKEKEEEESKRKMKSNLLDKYLDFLKEQTKEKNYVAMEDYEKLRKEYFDQLIDLTSNYTDAFQQKLRTLIKNFQAAEKAKAIESNPQKCDQYKKVLEYLIEMSQQGRMDEVNLSHLFDTQEKEPAQSENPEQS